MAAGCDLTESSFGHETALRLLSPRVQGSAVSVTGAPASASSIPSLGFAQALGFDRPLPGHAQSNARLARQDSFGDYPDWQERDVAFVRLSLGRAESLEGGKLPAHEPPG